ncbi:GntR family transcriptional regulator [Brevibacterium antiquum]|uniref:GntR family transcriptional regulator n=1 Tax=Brevibacterium antiquum TaxID=234835 RepID=UPI0018DFD8AF|nr:GntR family transcriptional regulator [Brevibacterium antiquum]
MTKVTVRINDRSKLENMSIPNQPGRRESRTVKQSAKDMAYQHISEQILRGTFAAGEFLDETELALAIGVSRTPIREALLRLQAERFIELLPRRGAQVRSITVSEMHEVYETRIMIESTAYGRICRAHRPIPSAARDLIAEMKAAGDSQDWPAYGQLDQRFHSLLVQCADNSVMHHLYESLRPQHVRIAIRAIRESPRRRSTIEREHERILDALTEGDDERAATILREHLREVPEVVEALD